MLRLSVVHSPVGPQQGPGLDEDLQSPGLEDSVMYPGASVFEWWKPYGGYGEDREQDVPGKGHAPRRKAVYAIDFDGTVTLDPVFFRKLTRDVAAAGGECHLVTGRPEAERPQVVRYLKAYNIEFSGMHFYPVPYHRDWVAWDALMDARVGAWKARVIEEIGADVMVDDNPVYAARVVKRLPGITVLSPSGGK